MAQGSNNNDAFMGSAAQFMQAGQNMMQQFMDYLGKSAGQLARCLSRWPTRRP
jgi:polyhydroxyalkanoate synthase